MKHKVLGSMLLVFCLSFASSTTLVNQCEDKGASKIEKASFENDYLYMGNELSFSGEAEDLFFFGQLLDFSGKTRLGMIAAGKKILIRGTVGNGIISGCKDMVLDGNITGTNFIGCKKLLISDSAHITGDLFTGCGELTINGIVDGNAYIGAGKVTINNEINGDVKVYGGRVIITERGRINGNLTYGTKENLTESELSRVTGEIIYKKDKDIEEFYNFHPKALIAFKIIFGLLLALSFFVVGSMLLFLPVFKKIEPIPAPKTFLRTALWGLIPIFMYPAVVVLSFVMVITIPFAVVLLLAFFPLFFIAYIIGATRVGQFLAMKFKWNIQKRHYYFFVGALASALLSIIPVIDFFTFLLLSSLGWGTFISLLFNKSFEDSENAKAVKIETEVKQENA